MLRILVVDDEPVNREFLLLALRGRGECLAVGSGEAAVAACSAALEEARPFGLVLLDIMLPGISGLQALEQLRALEQASGVPESGRAKVIITTSLDDDQKASRAFIHGHAAAYITKPFRLRDIHEELARLGLLEP